MNDIHAFKVSVAPHHDALRIAAVIPAYKVAAHIVDVVSSVLPYCERVFVVDDCCPEGSGKLVLASFDDSRIEVIFNAENAGVGGAVMAGYRAAVDAGIDVIVKVDGDGQMDASLLPEFVLPIARGEADYTKGNRFFDLRNISAMPRMRIFGNAALSFMAKLSTGYWDIFDPTNGYTAIHADVARRLPYDRISKRYFFETDLMFRLNTLRATVVDIPMDAKYGDEVSNLHIRRILGEFLVKHAKNFVKRIFYNYFLRDVSLASVELVLSLALLTFALVFGGGHWVSSANDGRSTPVGTIMITAVSLIWGLQLLLAFIGYDISTVPRRAIHRHHRKPRL